MPMRALLKKVGGFASFLFDRFNQDRCLQIAGSLTYTTILSLVPLFTIVVAVMSALPFFEKIMVDIKIFLLLNLVPDIAYKIITVYMEQFADNAARLTIYGLGALLLMALAMLFTVDRSLNGIWRAQRTRPFWMSVLGYMLLLALAPLLLGAGMTITSYLFSLSMGVKHNVPFFDQVLLKLLAILGSTVTFFLVYRIVPCRFVPARHALIGALIAAVLFETMKYLFGIFISRVPTYDLVYGAFAAIPIFLLWVFLSWVMVLLGAEVTAAMSYWRGSAWRRVGLAETNLHDGLLLLRALIAAQREGRSLKLADLQREVPIPVDRLEDLLDALLSRGVIARDPGMGARYRMVKTAEELSLADAYRLFVVPGGDPDMAPGEEFAPVLAEIARTLEDGLRRPLSQVFVAQDDARPANASTKD
jgi:membrane protein